MLKFTIHKTSGRARTGTLQTPHGSVRTPVFMPVGTVGTVKGVTPDQLRDCGVQMVLANSYHLMLRPGADVVEGLGGLHRFMAWDGPILTDSGGYQVFSLAAMRTISPEGVTFQSHIDGATARLTPESCIEIQSKLGADVIMQLDECPPGQADYGAVACAVDHSADWAARCARAWRDRQQAQGQDQALFGIQQGGVHLDLRAVSARRIVELDLPGYAVGGLSVGEGHERMLEVLEHVDGQLPREKPRYLMGVGEPRDMLAAVARGVDMFDCVMPTRNGRNAQAFTWNGRMKLRNACHTRDGRPIDEHCPCYACRHYSRAALRHYFMAQEMLGPTLLTIHNLAFFAQFMNAIAQAIAEDALAQRSAGWLEQMYNQEKSEQ